MEKNKLIKVTVQLNVDELGCSQIMHENVSVCVFEERLLNHLEAHIKEVSITKDHSQIPNMPRLLEFLNQFLPDYKLDDLKELANMVPRISAIRGDKWVVCHVDPSNQWKFYFEEHNGKLIETPVPENLTIDEDGSLRGDKVLYPVAKFPWPWPIQRPEEYFHIGEFYEFIEEVWIEHVDEILYPSDENPLTILLRSPQPYKGLANQIVESLRDIENILYNKLC